MMDESRFWQIIDRTREEAKDRPRQKHIDFIEVHEETLAEALQKMSPEEILEFDVRLTRLFHKAYRWDLWAAAYWLHGGCSDDGFMDFRGCLISLGEKAYYSILENPDLLASAYDDSNAPFLLAEGFLYVPNRVYEQKTGSEVPDRDLPKHPHEPAGDRLDHDDEDVMRRHFPNLVARYPEMG